MLGLTLRQQVRFLAFGIALGAACGAYAESGPKLPPVPAEVMKGEIWVGRADAESDDVPTFVAYALIDAPPKMVWQVVSHCGGYASYMPRVLASRELSKEGDIVVCEVTIDMPFPFSDLTSVTRAVHRADATSGQYSRVWNLVKGDYDVNKGAWRLRAVENGTRTLATYQVTAKPDIPVPTGLAALFQQGPLIKSMEALRRETRSRMAATQP